jgi:hypothetical protein
MAYRKLITRGNDDEANAQNTQAKLASIVMSRGLHGLVICPKELRLDWERAKSLPPGWMVWNFGAIRGRDGRAFQGLRVTHG